MNAAEIISDSQKIIIISGHARGADCLGKRYAADHGLQTVLFPAEWDKWGKSAGHIRNAEMAKYASKSGGMLIAFWDGQSRGTTNMIETTERYDLDVKIVRY